ncbi:right-handed parallel beta-helix repeat-containing protein [Salinispora arenicola]|uniref:right-handed parallel beta-helix repeat-containing protein n=1 Tax=Salinispora arenicola TaxID=168697 RepID=UPI000476CEC5|nr:right-handed parallel beta-helix repeat-containing protein [Salinispora arenicola]
MNDQCHEHELDPPGARRARSRWWAVGLAGMTGLALTTSLGIGGAPAFGAVDGILTAADDRRGKPDRASTDSKDYEGKGKKDKRKGTPVPCSADALIAAITLGNARGGAVLDLARDCTYLLTANIDGAGLPAITTPITLNGGKHTSITRAATAEQFRILTVDTGGDLTLNKLKISGGQTPETGGGIHVTDGGRLTTRHSTITRNSANANGGGIYSAGVLAVEYTTVSRNTANNSSGGGIYNSGGQLTIVKSLIKANSANSSGGVISNGSSAVATIKGSVIADNSALGTVGGLLVINDGIGRVYDTKFTGNSAGLFGAIYIDGQLTLQNFELTNNTASSGFAGGLYVGADSTATASKGIIKNNVSLINNGGGVYVAPRSQLVMYDTKVIGNQAEQGGGIYNSFDSTLTLFNTKVVRNTAVINGGGIFNAGGTVNLNTATGTTVVKNRPNNCVNVTGCPG